MSRTFPGSPLLQRACSRSVSSLKSWRSWNRSSPMSPTLLQKTSRCYQIAPSSSSSSSFRGKARQSDYPEGHLCGHLDGLEGFDGVPWSLATLLWLSAVGRGLPAAGSGTLWVLEWNTHIHYNSLFLKCLGYVRTGQF